MDGCDEYGTHHYCSRSRNSDGTLKIPLDMDCSCRLAPMSGPTIILVIENAAAKARIGQFVKQIMQY
eukprot:8094446-Ditylum_brightwellii.AAC.1